MLRLLACLVQLVLLLYNCFLVLKDLADTKKQRGKAYRREPYVLGSVILADRSHRQFGTHGHNEATREGEKAQIRKLHLRPTYN